jgi:predicted CXXCH cytochrome family protein
MKHRVSPTVIILLAVLPWLALACPVAAQEMGEDCFACHRQPNLTGIEGTRADIALCLDCHADPQVDEWALVERTPLQMDAAQYRDTMHGGIACIACHSDVARNPHTGEIMTCEDCHAAILSHVNMGAPHRSTDCAACHLEPLPVTQDTQTGRVTLAEIDANGTLVNRTSHEIVTEAGCDKCHSPGNQVGAPSVVLPARSVLCMPCHDASPTVSVAAFDPTPVKTDYGSLIGLVIFGAGLVLNVSLYLRGEIPGHAGLTTMGKLNYLAADLVRFIFSWRIFRFLWGLIADGIFLRRSLRESVGRWVMHTLIYWPFLVRLGLGLLTWLGQVLWPSAAWTQTLSDKNAPGVALTYDLTALLILVGVLFALVRRFILRDRRLLTFEQDKTAIFLLGALFLIGPVAEGVRLLSANVPQDNAVYSFLGYAVAVLLRPLNLTWTSVYPVIWYLHAWLAVAFIAYLPFSKFMHILISPFIVSLDAARKESH